jgi:hypothetical protein
VAPKDLPILENQVLAENSLALGIAMLPGDVVLRKDCLSATAIGIVTTVGAATTYKVCADTVAGENLKLWRHIIADRVSAPHERVIFDSNHFYWFCNTRELKVS